jgi:hypothetical protein
VKFRSTKAPPVTITTVGHNVVRDTGLLTRFFGEGIYVGTAHCNNVAAGAGGGISNVTCWNA